MSGCVALRRSSTGGVVTWLVTRFIGPSTSSLATPTAVLSSNAQAQAPRVSRCDLGGLIRPAGTVGCSTDRITEHPDPVNLYLHYVA